jgi:site-specific recombinase XerD
MSCRFAWRSLRKSAVDHITERAKQENRELSPLGTEYAQDFLQTLRFHDLRHSFITLMGEQGVPLQVVQAMVGHMSAHMVRYYTHISNRAARDAVELLDKQSDPICGECPAHARAGP